MSLFDNIGKDVLRTIPTIDIGFAVSLMGDIFGFNSPVYIPYSLKDKYALGDIMYNIDSGSGGKFYASDRYNIVLVGDDEASRLSQFGTPVLGTFTTYGGQYKVYDKRTGRLVDKEFGEFEFPVATIVDFSRAKNITKTPTIGSSGTVKEIFGFEDWKINIRGVCLNDNSRVSQKTSREQQLAMIALNEIADSVGILKGALFLDKRITRMVIENLTFTAVQGKPDIIQFEMECVSDEDFLIFDA